MKLLFAAGTLPMVANAPLFKTDRGPVRAVTVNGVHLVATQKDGMNVTVSVEGVASLQTAIQAAIKATERKLPILVSVEKVDSYAAAMRAAMGDYSADFDTVASCAVPDDSNAMCGQMLDDLVAALRVSEGKYFCIVVENASREGVRLPDMPRLLDKAYEQYDSDRETGSVGLAMDAATQSGLFIRKVDEREGRASDYPDLAMHTAPESGSFRTKDGLNFTFQKGGNIAVVEMGRAVMVFSFNTKNIFGALDAKNLGGQTNFKKLLKLPVGRGFNYP